MQFQRCRRGFTLIEMVVALTLSAILLVILNGVLQRCFAEMRAAQNDPLVHSTTLLVEQLRRDFTNARQLRMGPNRFELVGFLQRDTKSLVSTQLPARVVYEIRKNGKQALLIRIQYVQTNAMSVTASVEPVWEGLESMTLMSDQLGAIAELTSTPLDNRSNAVDLTENRVPTPLRLTLRDRKGTVIVEEVFLRPREAG
jgi:prepilin-type N-terminal cleavage/methylation domain-containing protein